MGLMVTAVGMSVYGVGVWVKVWGLDFRCRMVGFTVQG